MQRPQMSQSCDSMGAAGLNNDISGMKGVTSRTSRCCCALFSVSKGFDKLSHSSIFPSKPHYSSTSVVLVERWASLRAEHFKSTYTPVQPAFLVSLSAMRLQVFHGRPPFLLPWSFQSNLIFYMV